MHRRNMCWSSGIDHRWSGGHTETRPVVGLLISIAAALAIALALAYAPVVLAGAPQRPLTVGTVSTCSEAALRAALAGGGTVTFSLSGPCTITVASSILITAPTTIDGSGSNVTISGNGLQRIITTTAGVGTLAIQSITFTHGVVPVGSGLDGSGGALMVRGALALTNATFISNTVVGAGGAVYVTDTATIHDSLFRNNVANSSFGPGGAVMASVGLTLSGTQFLTNSASFGGGAATNGSATVKGGLFQNNQASSTTRGGGGIYALTTLALTGTQFVENIGGNGGGVFAASDATVSSAVFLRNQSTSASFGGGGIIVQSNLVLKNSLLISNASAYIGGGAYVFGAATVSDSVFQSNSAIGGQDGGGLTADGGAVVTGTRFLRNSAATGGALSLGSLGSGHSRIVNGYLIGNTATGGSGSAILWWDASHSLTVLHTTISSPTLSAGSAIHVLNGSVGITDTIISSAAVGINQVSGNVYEDFNLFTNVTTPTSGGVTSGTHRPTGSAAFVNPSADNYQLGVTSAAIDAGVDAGVNQDFDGQLRPQGGGFDIGADESAFSVDLALAKAATPAVAAPGDRVTFTLAYTHSGSGGIAYGVRITDQVPLSLTNVTFTSSGAAITATGGIAYAWQVADLPAGSGGVITLSGIVSPGLVGLPVILANTATITGSGGDNAPGNNASNAVLSLIHAAITGLAAANSGPSLLGATTALTASATGDNITYTWRFGDGPATATGSIQTHTYAAIGAYTATVTATNGISTVATTTNVSILDVPISGLAAVNSSPTLFSHPTALTATVSGGTGINYQWNFGDGTGTGSGAVLTHTYAQVGSFTATVTATNSYNSSVKLTTVTITGYTLDLPLINR